MNVSGLLFSIGLFLALPQFVFGQPAYALTARLTNTHQEPVSVHARLLSVPDSALLKSGVFPDGLVSFSAIPHRNAVLHVSSVGLADSRIPIQNPTQSTLDLGVIVLQERNAQLTEVRIRGQAPLVRYGENGSVDIQVAGTILAGSTSVNQILERSPGITFNEGRINVVGKGEALIFLNGQAITYEQLVSIPVSQIVRVEIIANPSARYDAEGKAIVRVITRTNPERGTTGSVTLQYTHSAFAGDESNTLSDLTYRKGKLTVAANYTLRGGNDREILYTTRTRPATSNYLYSELTTDWQRKLHNYSSYGLGVQYNLTEKTYVSLGYKGNFDKLGGNQYSRNSLTNAVDKGVYKSTLSKNEQRLNHSLIFNYNQTLDSLGSSLFLGSQLASFSTDIHDQISENNLLNDSSFAQQLKNDQAYTILISSTQADYTRMLRASKKLETGFKFTYAHTTSGTDFLVAAADTDFQLDPNLSSHFAYAELIPAAYINYSGSLGKQLRFGAGLRSEWTYYDLSTTAGSGQVIQKNYLSVFPNLSLSKTVSDELDFRLSYVSKIARPRYQALNPYVIYQDPFTSIQGNPNLRPEKIHSFEIGMKYKLIDLRAGYNYTIDPISGAALRGDGPNSYVLKGINLEKDNTFFLSGSTTLTINWWNTTNTITLSQSNSVDNQYGFQLVTPRPQLYVYTNNTFTIRNVVKLQLLAWYLGDKYYGLYHDKSRATVTFGMEKDFFKNAWKLRLTANDIFHQTNRAGYYSVGETDIYYNRTYSTSSFNISLTYRFGKPLKATYRSQSTAETEQNRAR
ncbi:TonB-dependent receptor domain-containing protein [Spirosoma sp.]|uniref:TonB-dependent receptor domain-containing protein n=1 Tax=Spirosoma sp. TaxID=1899569 RepID=UPI003B3A95FF